MESASSKLQGTDVIIEATTSTGQEDEPAVPAAAASTGSGPVRRRNFATRNRSASATPTQALGSFASGWEDKSGQDASSIKLGDTSAGQGSAVLGEKSEMQQSPYASVDSMDTGNGSGLDEQADALNRQQGQHEAQQQQGQLDSITLGELRNLVNNHKPKARQYSYPTQADSDTLPKEIDEFYSYVEAPQVTENRAAWEEWCTLAAKGEVVPSSSTEDKAKGDTGPSFSGGALGLGLEESFGVSTSDGERASSVGEWTNLPTSARRKRIQALLTLLEVKDPTARQRASRALLYLLQGSFADTKGVEHQMTWVIENARMVRAAGGLGEIYSAFKIASWKHDWLRCVSGAVPV